MFRDLKLQIAVRGRGWGELVTSLCEKGQKLLAEINVSKVNLNCILLFIQILRKRVASLLQQSNK